MQSADASTTTEPDLGRRFGKVPAVEAFRPRCDLLRRAALRYARRCGLSWLASPSTVRARWMICTTRQSCSLLRRLGAELQLGHDAGCFGTRPLARLRLVSERPHTLFTSLVDGCSTISSTSPGRTTHQRAGRVAPSENIQRLRRVHALSAQGCKRRRRRCRGRPQSAARFRQLVDAGAQTVPSKANDRDELPATAVLQRVAVKSALQAMLLLAVRWRS